MNTNRSALEAFLSEHIKDLTFVELVMKELESLFLIVESGKYTLAQASEELRAEAAQVIGSTLGIPTPKIEFVSLADQQYPELDLMCGARYYICLWQNLYSSHSNGPMVGIGVSLGESLMASLRASFMVNLGVCFYNSLSESLKSSDVAEAWRNFGIGLFHFPGFAIVGYRKNVELLTPLIRLLPWAVPMAEKIDEPGTWLVLIA